MPFTRVPNEAEAFARGPDGLEPDAPEVALSSRLDALEGVNADARLDSMESSVGRLPINVMDSLPPNADVVRGVDSSAALQARHDLAATSGRPVYYPGGSDFIAANLQLDTGARVFGDFGLTTIKLASSAAVASGGSLAYSHRQIFTNKHGGTTGNSGISISHMTLDGNVSGSNSADEFYFGIALWSVQDVSLEWLRIKNVRGDGIIVGRNPAVTPESEDVHISKIYLENVGVDAGVGAARQGISIVQARRFTIRDVVAATVGSYVVDIEPDVGTQIVEDFTIDGIHAYNVAACVGLGQTSGTIRRGKIGVVTLRDGVDFSPAYVVSLQNCDSITVDRPECDAASVVYPVWSDATATNIKIRGVGEVCRLSRNASMTNIANTTATTVEWNVEREDRDGMHDPTDATSRKKITAKAAGLYVPSINLRWSSTAGTYRQVNVRKNGTSTFAIDKRAAAINQMSCTFPPVTLAQGDYIEFIVEHDAGSAIDVLLDADYSPECGLVKVG